MVTPILHVSQIASALGLPAPAGGDASRLAWELFSALERWLTLIRPLSLERLAAPTDSRGRSIRNLTVNVFHPVTLLPGAWESGAFDWDPDGDDEREAVLGSAAEVVAYAERIAGDWTAFLLEAGDDLNADVRVTSPRGELPYAELLDSQAGHAAFHLAQIEDALRSGGTGPAPTPGHGASSGRGGSPV